MSGFLIEVGPQSRRRFLARENALMARCRMRGKNVNTAHMCECGKNERFFLIKEAIVYFS